MRGNWDWNIVPEGAGWPASTAFLVLIEKTVGVPHFS
jgi:hypothetical protein